MKSTKAPIFDYISFEGYFIDIKEHRTVFRLPDMPRDVHYTLSYHPKSDFVNLHLTREIKTNKKPKITIVKIAKKELEQNAETIALSVFQIMFRYVSKEELVAMRCDWVEISNDISGQKLLENSAKEEFIGKYSVKRKTRLKLKDNISDSIENIVKRGDVQDHYSNLEYQSTDELIDGVYYSVSDNPIMIMFQEGSYFQFRSDYIEQPFLSQFLGQQLYSQFTAKIETALEVVSKACSYEDTKELDNPINLYWPERKDIDN